MTYCNVIENNLVDLCGLGFGFGDICKQMITATQICLEVSSNLAFYYSIAMLGSCDDCI